MPIYTFRCLCHEDKEYIFDVEYTVKEYSELEGTGKIVCPHCGCAVVRHYNAPPSVHYKGAGWYSKDNGVRDEST